MTYPDKEKSLQLLKCWRARYAEIEVQRDAIAKIFGSDVGTDGIYSITMWSIWEAYTITLAELVGDKGGWLDWYCNENGMGVGGHPAKPRDGQKKHKLRKIKTIEDLYWLIEQSREAA